LITASDIFKSYGEKAVLSGINFTANSGESVVIVGRNGAGKSTFLSILSGYLRPDSGNVAVSDRNVAFCPQRDNLFEELTVRDNILFWARAKGSELGFKDLDFVELFGINEYAHKKVRYLSGGMKKSVAIICALSGGAEVLVLDEPFSGLDIFYKDVLLKAFDKLKSMGKCIIYTSHNIDEITGLDSKVYALTSGNLTPVDITITEKDSDYNVLRRGLLEHSKS